jgi:hypothetical protein
MQSTPGPDMILFIPQTLIEKLAGLRYDFAAIIRRLEEQS